MPRLLQRESRLAFGGIIASGIASGEDGAERPRFRPFSYGSLTLPVLQFGLSIATAAVLVVRLRASSLGSALVVAMVFAVALLSLISSTGALHARRTRSTLISQNRRLRDEAYTDALTGLGNRRRFDEQLRMAWRDSAERQAILSLVLIDVDHFKTFNDHSGHLEGDRALRALGDVLRHCGRRSVDQAFRFGGEEFALLLPDTAVPGASKVATEVRDAIAGLRIRHAASGTGLLTVSMGVSQAVPARHANDPERFLAAADEALYEAKRDGRNKIKVGLFPDARAAGRIGSTEVSVDGCEIIMANGRKVRISATLDTATLSSILQVVAADG